MTYQLQADVVPIRIDRPYVSGRNVVKVVYDQTFNQDYVPVPSDFVVTVAGVPVTIIDVDWKNLWSYRLYSDLVPAWVGEVVVTFATPTSRLRLLDGRLADPYSMITEPASKSFDIDDAYKFDKHELLQ